MTTSNRIPRVAAAAVDLAAVNPAERVHDGERVLIPFLSTPVPTRDPNQPAPIDQARPSAVAGPININTATAAELDTLPGIGPAIAARIVAYRDSHGAFASVDELADVSGISARMVDNLRPLITTGP